MTRIPTFYQVWNSDSSFIPEVFESYSFVIPKVHISENEIGFVISKMK